MERGLFYTVGRRTLKRNRLPTLTKAKVPPVLLLFKSVVLVFSDDWNVRRWPHPRRVGRVVRCIPRTDVGGDNTEELPMPW